MGIILKATRTSAVLGFTPTLPGQDTVAITSVLTSMLFSLSNLYKLGISKESLAPFIASISAKQFAVSITKLMPFFIGNLITSKEAEINTLGIGLFIKEQFKYKSIEKIWGYSVDNIDFNTKSVFKYIEDNKQVIKNILNNKKYLNLRKNN